MTIMFLAAAAALAACGTDAGGSPDGKLLVTATTGMIADAAKEIGGDDVEVTALMGAGTDPHLYKASQGDIEKLDRADLVLYNGLHLEGKMAELFEKMEKTKPTVAVAAGIPESELLTAPGAAGEISHDPHIWFDVKLWSIAAGTIRDALIEKDPQNKEKYEERAEAYLNKLVELDAYAKEQIAAIPEQSRVLVTAHDAFGYFGKAYGIEVRGLQGMNTMAEYGSKDVSDLRDFLIENNIKAVFIESSVPHKSIEAVIEGAKSLGHDIKIGGELFSDAMGEEGTEEGSYIGMVKHNVDTIVRALK
ncbi:metal ABC transporter solute-binding protein, Zn/Mn family [Paenibacillus thailandensis]|uniref:Metal ABC transporter solute-binding protein, Zn/Mn family n=1 Tax=Paenibacillus thailandensis TaxID=393250 RepID=A0ABW5QTD8_9BACL